MQHSEEAKQVVGPGPSAAAAGAAAGRPRPGRRFGPRSAAARLAILEAARARFAADGYEKATIRAIAAEAGVDPAMVMRYYGSKAGLFSATVRAGEEPADLSRVPRQEMGGHVARLLLDPWERGTNGAEAAVLRAAPTHAEAARSVQATVAGRLVPALRGAFPDDPDLETRAGLVLTQSLGAALLRYVLRVEPVASMDYETLVAFVGAAIQHHLTAPLPARLDAPDGIPGTRVANDTISSFPDRGGAAGRAQDTLR
ncbi:TetR/AcrR family transcriptional regulator [Streptomyces sp. 8K308]|uniref:TetR/AcrR family transcriptional regulator n=1 Tax=Streptomyces sp. 8K308 TaxID=2530388 RepID=UPI0010516CEE|nr:TetR family transcriptional regulator [Streptomyces sp. 8K308]TDC19394.1 TetR/AcrR family transcriptional regulator [Streptomyces sp. 8K308]